MDRRGSAQTVTVDVHASDGLSGIAGIQVSHTDGTRYLGQTLHLLSGGSQRNGPRGPHVTIPQSSPQRSSALSPGIVENIGNRQ
jgi:hypothetical protein